MNEVEIPEALAVLLTSTGEQLVNDIALLQEHISGIHPDVMFVMELHAKAGQALIDFVKRTRDKGLVREDPS